MTTKEQQANVDHLAIIITNYIGENDVGFKNIAVLNGLYDSLHISSNLKNWWDDRVARALRKTDKESR